MGIVPLSFFLLNPSPILFASGDFQDFLDEEIFMAGPGTVQAAVAFLSPGINFFIFCIHILTVPKQALSELQSTYDVVQF